MDIIQQLDKEQVERLSAGKEIPDFQPGDTVLVNVKVVEGDKARVQAYEGVCIGRSGRGINENFTVRKISYGEGVERVFPLYSPMIDSIKVVRRGKVRRAKLYYLRGLRGKKARISEAQGASRAGRCRGRARIAASQSANASRGRMSAPFSWTAFVVEATAIGYIAPMVSKAQRIVLVDHARLPWRFFGRLTAVQAGL